MAGDCAFGTTLEKGAAAIAELTSISGPTMTADTIDVSSHDSADQFREFVACMKDSGEITLAGNMDTTDAGQVALYTDLCDGSLDAYTITFPDAGATTWTFNALVTALSTDAPYDGKISFSATMKISGKATLTP